MTNPSADVGRKVAIRSWLGNRGWQSLLDIAPDLLADIERIVERGVSLGRACLAGVSAVLWRLCGSHDRMAQDIAYTALANWLRKIAVRLCNDIGSVNDTTQRALEAIHQKLQSVRDAAAFLGFCKVVTQREAIRRCVSPLAGENEITFTDLENNSPDNWSTEDQFPDDAEPVEDAIPDKLMGLGVWRCLQACIAISARQKSALRMLHVDQMTTREITAALKLTASALYADVSRALSTLRTDLAFAECLKDVGVSWGS